MTSTASFEIVTPIDDPVATAAAWKSVVEQSVPVSSPSRKHHISLLSAFMMLTTWSTSSSNVLYPFTFGVLGVVGGPLLMLAAFFVNWRCTRWTVEAARASNSDTFGALGQALAGTKGRIMFEGSQILFQQLFLPVAIVLCASTVQSLDGGGHRSSGRLIDCNGNVALLFTIISFGLVQVSRQLQHVTGIAYVSCALNVVMTCAIAFEVSLRAAPSSSNLTAPAAVELFVGIGDHPARYHWANVLGALGTFIYSCLPSCIVVETMAELSPVDRPKMKHAVDASFVAYVSLYCVAGIPAVLSWGGDLPEPLHLGNTPAGVFVKLVLISGTGLDFVLASITVNRWAVRRVDPQFDYSWTARNAQRWAFYCLPSSLLAISMALFVPRLESLTGLLNSLAGTTLQVTATSLCLLITTNDQVHALRKQEGGARRWRFAFTAAVGVLFTVAVFTSAVYNMATTQYVPGPGESFWCDLAG
mmetsp:Transcript_16449/g.42192  ORF Transcript_16449/g.42192 Transcript_16449/m.42192 type:complete len:473 (+) Transcript_16449:93-1511(+)